MATKEFKARLVNKIDTYANWTSNDPVLLKGEIAIVDVPASTDVVQQEPAVLMKIGDGTKKFSELPWISAKSADVYSWALAPTKPTYQASEIEGLDAYISGKVEDTDTQYQLIKVNNTTFKLQSKPLNGSDVGDPISVVYTLTTGTTNGTVKFNGTDVAVAGLKSAAYQESSAFDTAGAAATAQSVAEDHADTIVGEAKTDLIGTGSATSTTIKGAVQESNTYTDNQIAAKIGSVYKPVGSVNFANLPKIPSKTELGNVYNVNDAFEADTRFVTAEVGEHFPAGTNVAVIVEDDTYYFDALSGAVDLTNYYTKTETDQQITTKIGSLDKADSAVANQFVTVVSQTDGIISVTRAAITEAAIPTLSQSKISGLETALSAKIDASAVSQIGKTGNINDATQIEGDYLIINCGTSSDVI
jgi:hypothetical protein